MRYETIYESPLGALTLEADGAALTALRLPVWRQPLKQSELAQREDDLPIFRLTKRWLDVYFSGKDPGRLPPINTSGSSFQKLVWAELLKIPYGKLTTYGAIAKTLEEKTGRRVSAQAVGGAVGRNPIAILIPCHRVVGSNGSLTGYGGGLDSKIRLLSVEHMDQIRQRGPLDDIIL